MWTVFYLQWMLFTSNSQLHKILHQGYYLDLIYNSVPKIKDCMLIKLWIFKGLWHVRLSEFNPVHKNVKMCKLNCHQDQEHTVLTVLQYVNKLNWPKPLIDLKLSVCLVVFGISYLQGYIMLQYMYTSVVQQDFGIVHWPSLRASRSLRRSSALLSRSLNSRCCSFCCSRNFRSRSRWRSICSNRSLWPN